MSSFPCEAVFLNSCQEDEKRELFKAAQENDHTPETASVSNSLQLVRETLRGCHRLGPPTASSRRNVAKIPSLA